MDELIITGKHPHPEQLSALVLAYVGDAVYELAVRCHLAAGGSNKMWYLHRQAVQYVRAANQAKVLFALEGKLTEAEQQVVRRGRNTNSQVPKGASMIDYRHSTALECLVGYLYLKGDSGRIKEIMETARQVIEEPGSAGENKDG